MFYSCILKTTCPTAFAATKSASSSTSNFGYIPKQPETSANSFALNGRYMLTLQYSHLVLDAQFHLTY